MLRLTIQQILQRSCVSHVRGKYPQMLLFEFQHEMFTWFMFSFNPEVSYGVQCSVITLNVTSMCTAAGQQEISLNLFSPDRKRFLLQGTRVFSLWNRSSNKQGGGRLVMYGHSFPLIPSHSLSPGAIPAGQLSSFRMDKVPAPCF